MVRSFLTVVAIGAVLLGGIWFFTKGPGIEGLKSLTGGDQSAEMSSPAGEDPLDAPGLGSSLPRFDIVRISQSRSAVLAGQAVPNADVEVLANGELLAGAKANNRGEWAMTVDGPMQPGTTELRLKSIAPDGTLTWGSGVVVVTVPEGDGEALAVLMEDGVSSRVFQGVDMNGMAAAPIGVQAVDYDSKGNLILSGWAPAGAEVIAYLDNKPIGSAVADENGKWRLTPHVQIPAGQYMLRLDQIETGGKVVNRVELPIERARPEDIVFSKGRVVVQPGNSLWRIARHVYGSGFAYTTIYEANSNQIRDPDLIYPGQIFSVPGAKAE